MSQQLSIFEPEPKTRKYIFGIGEKIQPYVPSKSQTPYDKQIYLSELLPLEEYDKIIVLFSGGKDSAAAYLELLRFGVPKEKIELWHHDIDGHHPTRRMDWPVTQNYIRSFAEAEGVRLRVSWRRNGFWGEVYRLGASWQIEYEDGSEIKSCRLSDRQIRSMELREKVLNEIERQELVAMGSRMKFPAKTGDLARRWCSAYLKIDVVDTVIRDLEELKNIGERNKFPAKSGCHQGRWCSGSLKAQVESGLYSNIERLRENVKILVVSGERREESSGRAKYNEIEIHRTNATTKAHRLVHQWRLVIDYTEREVWDILKRYRITPHPCYSAGWNRCSCMMCIFSLPKHWAGIRELFPEQYAEVVADEKRLGFTLDNKKTLDEYTGDAASCVAWDNEKAIQQLKTGEFSKNDIYTENWQYPVGAFQGVAGGPC